MRSGGNPWRAARGARHGWPATFTVNDTGSGGDFSAGNGVCETGSGNGICTLRAAIEEINARSGGDTINFGIVSGSPPWTITPNPTLPTISKAVTIDGTTQTGWTMGAPVVELNGSSLPGAADDLLTLGVSGSTVMGLVIRRQRQTSSPRSGRPGHRHLRNLRPGVR